MRSLRRKIKTQKRKPQEYIDIQGVSYCERLRKKRPQFTAFHRNSPQYFADSILCIDLESPPQFVLPFLYLRAPYLLRS